ncbi:hypothetical protein KCU99_g1753, partial [Aureobasidium melanogenum]
MAPKRANQQGAISQVYTSLASPDNRSVVTAVAFFAAGVAFLHSSWSEMLLPPLIWDVISSYTDPFDATRKAALYPDRYDDDDFTEPMHHIEDIR